MVSVDSGIYHMVRPYVLGIVYNLIENYSYL